MNLNPYQSPGPQTQANGPTPKPARKTYLQLIPFFVSPAIWVGLGFGGIMSQAGNFMLALVFGYVSALVFAITVPAILLLVGRMKGQ